MRLHAVINSLIFIGEVQIDSGNTFRNHSDGLIESCVELSRFILYLFGFLICHDRFARQPDQWKSRQASQQSALKEFYATFGPTETKSFEKESFLADTVPKSQPGKLKDIRKEIETTLASAKTSNTPFLAHQVSKKVKRFKDEKKRHRKDGESESKRKKIKV